MPYLFTSESVSEGHPDKIADQISDAVLDAMLRQDPHSRVACETLVTTGQVVLAGEITTQAYVDLQQIVRDTIDQIGYTSDEYMFSANSCSILSALHEQSPDIARGVDSDEDAEKDQGAGDQGMMFGYATDETPEYMPMALAFSHRLVQELANIRKNEDLMPYLRPDSKAQVTIEYSDDDKPLRVHTVVLSTQHDDFILAADDSAEAQVQADDTMLGKIREDVINILIPRVIPAELLDDNTIFHVNPTGKFVIGGPHGDAGLTGRKIIVDTYGGKGAHGGGAFSGKDPSKVDRSAAYASRHLAKNLVAAGVASEVLVQLAYAIGVAEPVSIFVHTYGKSNLSISDAEIADKIKAGISFTPKAIEDRLGLRMPIYGRTAAYGHMGRESVEEEVELSYISTVMDGNNENITRVHEKRAVTFFGWERLDLVDKIKELLF